MERKKQRKEGRIKATEEGWKQANERRKQQREEGSSGS